MKQIIISFLLVMVLVACNELADNKPANTTERFPSFTLGKKTEKLSQLTPLVNGELGMTALSLVLYEEKSMAVNAQGEWYVSTAKPVLVVRSTLDVTGEKIGTVPEGGKVKVLEKNIKPDSIGGRSGSWVKIEWQNGIGYVFDQFLKNLK